jgi:hypothetical protein
MQPATISRLIVALGVVLALGACEGVRKQFGLTKQSPDEFRVVSRAPLTLPPDFTLRPPEPGVPSPQTGSPTDQARRAIFRADAPKDQPAEAPPPADGLSPGERSLLKAAGADKAEPGIRIALERETNQLNNESDGFLEALVFWRKDAPPGVVIDASAEAKRLRENAALGKAVTAGRTPTIERRKKALLEGIF